MTTPTPPAPGQVWERDGIRWFVNCLFLDCFDDGGRLVSKITHVYSTQCDTKTRCISTLAQWELWSVAATLIDAGDKHDG